jgi:hypothetical protein
MKKSHLPPTPVRKFVPGRRYRGVQGKVVQWVEHRFEEGLLYIQSRRAFLPTACLGSMRAMTINQAKNREFEGVIVLWPFAVGGNLDSQRRRLYNALMRLESLDIRIAS